MSRKGTRTSASFESVGARPVIGLRHMEFIGGDMNCGLAESRARSVAIQRDSDTAPLKFGGAVMKSTLGAMLALVLAATSLAPEAAYARDYRHYDHGRSYYDHYRRRGRGDAVAAGVAGLVFGAILGAAVTSRHRRDRCDNGCGGY